MALVFEGRMQVLGAFNKFIKFNLLSDVKEKLPTGIYFYAIDNGGKIVKGKIVVFND